MNVFLFSRTESMHVEGGKPKRIKESNSNKIWELTALEKTPNVFWL